MIDRLLGFRRALLCGAISWIATAPTALNAQRVGPCYVYGALQFRGALEVTDRDVPRLTTYNIEYDCPSWSSHVFRNGDEMPASAAFSTRVTARLADGPLLLDESINTLSEPSGGQALEAAFERARTAIAAATRTDVAVSGPSLTYSASGTVPGVRLQHVDGQTVTTRTFELPRSYVCVGDLGDLLEPPAQPPVAPCAPRAYLVRLPDDHYGVSFVNSVNEVYTGSITHTHTATARDATVVLTGELRSLRYELVGRDVSATLLVPIVLSAKGLADAPYTSELVLTNRGTTSACISYDYRAALGGSDGNARETLPAGVQKTIPDAIAHLRALGVPVGDSGDRGGTLRVRMGCLSSRAAGAATVRTSTPVLSGGTANVSYAGLSPARLLSSVAVIGGLREDALDRSSVALVNAATEGELRLRLTVISGDRSAPVSRALPDVVLRPGGFKQLSGVLALAGIENGYVRVERVAGTGPFYAYGVVNDRISSDGSILEPLAAGPAPVPRLTLPVVVESPDYSTEVALTNTSGDVRALRLECPTLPGSPSLVVSLGPNEQRILPDFVQLLRDAGAGGSLLGDRGPTLASALYAVDAHDASADLRGIVLCGRTSTPSPSGGRLGVSFPASPAGSEATTSAWLHGLRQDAGARSNLAIVNVSAAAGTGSFLVEGFDASGESAGSIEVSVAARGFAQIDSVLNRLPRSVASGYLRVSRRSGSEPFLAFAIVNDGAMPGRGSGDGAFVAAIPD